MVTLAFDLEAVNAGDGNLRVGPCGMESGRLEKMTMRHLSQTADPVRLHR